MKKSTLSRIKRKLFKNNYLQTILVPDFKKLGCELMVFSHGIFDPKYGVKERSKACDKLMQACPFIFAIIGEVEGVALIPCKDYTEFKTMIEKHAADYHSKFFIKPPSRLMISVEKIKFIKEMDFAPLVKNALDLKVNI